MKNKVIDSDRFNCFPAVECVPFSSSPDARSRDSVFFENGRKCGSFVTGGTGKKPASFRLSGGSFGSAALVLAPGGM